MKSGKSLSLAWFSVVLVVAGCSSADESNRRKLAASAKAAARESSKPSKVDSATGLLSAVEQKRWDQAKAYAKRALVEHPEDPDVMMAAAEVASNDHDIDEMAELMLLACQLGDYQPSSRINAVGKSLFDLGRMYQVIELYETSLERHPDQQMLRKRLITFLLGAGRTDLANAHVEPLIRGGETDASLLCMITDLNQHRFKPEIGQRQVRLNPDDQRVRLGNAIYLYDVNKDDEAAVVLQQILAKHPGFAPAHALYGQLLTSAQRYEEMPQWYNSRGEESTNQANYWLTLGDWAAYRQDHQGACRSYWQATQIAPNKILAWSRLASAIGKLAGSASPEAQGFSDDQLADIERRVSDLQKVRQQIKGFQKNQMQSQRDAVQLAKLLAGLGRNLEAKAWCGIASRLYKDPTPDFSLVRKQVDANLELDDRWVSVSSQPALQIDLSDLPPPRFDSLQPDAGDRIVLSPKLESTDHLRMKDATSQWELGGVGGENNPGDVDVMPLERSLGIGGGTIDFDLDGLPDLVVAGAAGTMRGIDSKSNELLRNLGGRFGPVTEAAGAGDRHFGQGVAVGDFNQDGFPDLFYANFGHNVLLRNNGDGTFQDVSALLGEDAEQWTSCGAFVDVNLDGVVDLVTTNYCDALETIKQPCVNEAGVPGPCHPLKFAARDDVFLQGDGRGGFADVTSRWKAGVTPGRGLGILAGQLQPDHQAVYIANDMTANEYYLVDKSGGDPREDSAVVRGLALDGRSRSQASMGIASGDMDNDGDLDIFVTGFANEYHIYYEQVSPGTWVDSTGRQGLMEPTVLVVGFGTEAIDLDNDGLLELLVTNGHISEFPDRAVPLREPFQVFRRGVDGRFQLVDDDAWDDYFANNHIGRALWTIDANVDGKVDVLVTHTFEPAKLLINQTETENRRIAFRLVGTNSSRDAVGAVVTFEVDGQRRSLWATAGDGFMCSNERILRAGLGGSDRVNDVSVRWPDGTTEDFGSLSANQTYLLVQGQDTAFSGSH